MKKLRKETVAYPILVTYCPNPTSLQTEQIILNAAVSEAELNYTSEIRWSLLFKEKKFFHFKGVFIRWKCADRRYKIKAKTVDLIGNTEDWFTIGSECTWYETFSIGNYIELKYFLSDRKSKRK